MKKVWFAATAMALVFAFVPAHAATIDVRIIGFNYTPSGHVIVGLPTSGPTQDVATGDTPSIAAGTTITFTNLDAVPHTVTKLSAPTCNATCLLSGKTNTWAPKNVAGLSGTASLATSTLVSGAYTYQCTIHANMRGSFTIR